MDVDSFEVQFSFKGTICSVQSTLTSTANDLIGMAISVLDVPDGSKLKFLLKGKRIENTDDVVFKSIPKKTPKIIVLATQESTVQELNSKRSDPTIRGFNQERTKQTFELNKYDYWGPDTVQDKNYKFCRFEPCTWQSFGHRPTDTTPHDFDARKLLEKLATDPGIIAIMKERELVVGTLGEMDPIDDRLMQKKQQAGACLLGYNTNAGARIDIKLRTDDLKSFRPYSELASTLIHELSHNWVGEHNLLFWTNYGQMRAEYLYTHVRNNFRIVNGKTLSQLAGLDKMKMHSIDDVYQFLMQELTKEMAQHGLQPNMIATAIRERCNQLERSTPAGGQKLGRGGNSTNNDVVASGPRELALQAAERRRRTEEEEKRRENGLSKKEQNK